MPHPDRLLELREAGIVAVLRAPNTEAALRAVDALIAGGITAIEVTYSTPEPARVIREIIRNHGDAVYIGAGTIVHPGQAREVAEAGARFLVSPGTAPSLAAEMIATGGVVMLGAMTPSEVMLATSLGADAIKIFPASLGGPAYLGSLRGPFPEVPLMPTGGVTAANISQWFAAGAIAVGAGSDLCSPTAMAEGDWDRIEATARSFSSALAEARGR
ncbi:bifunctional 4-hydroxy-2-oxoglutarate aldolase/2-dehydro-3-deoxy-phosphogluconate aldolase [Cryobacterium glaciale]|uniref:Bifunctional 4-hydroxy-2-oxoglutarate aldolase/2-dehydro-3-deoxy-phosphogluconate aldolase n=1 Tax=Cryobacterium glaciale TaxID=1259145 RepID=A0A4R8V634_9MICO|nr:bifunctional 4-hydroxy-2-oxoglutarate aldolase/2-dehydro-3-deoxy-phosphogluconate aldolase [Cryobacterium glaciale]TFB76679.1 bifunctional 4-hydroxy-2-oxoglutarate aldolase/2-dehydro-3-deoxy-phosphogluconate aldolase [Cryobacterium glaciale]